MAKELTRKVGENGLSRDINVITAEINAYQRVAGEAIFEIGRRLKHVKENDLAHGEFGKWLKEINMNDRHARRFMKVYEEFGEGKRTSMSELGIAAMYEIATLPPAEREAEHVTAKGETKTPSEMTVRELRELKRQLRETERAKQKAEAIAEQARRKHSGLPPHKRIEYARDCRKSIYGIREGIVRGAAGVGESQERSFRRMVYGIRI